MQRRAEICPRSPSLPILLPVEGNLHPVEKQISSMSAIQLIPEWKNTPWFETEMFVFFF
jgi:hypothetical protein